MEKLDKIEKNQNIAHYYSWYFLGIPLVIGASSFIYTNRFDIAFGLYIIGMALIIWGFYKSHTLENKLKKKK
jgi:hypothetical protein